jgi:DNA-binding MarR family transcriptional regulator
MSPAPVAVGEPGSPEIVEFDAAESVMPTEILEPLEILIFEAIGMTAVALATASAGELTLAQWRALVVLGRSDAVRVGAIAAAIGGSLPSTSRLIQRLERRGLVTTERDESDRRATLVRITQNGRELRKAVLAARRRAMEGALCAFAPKLPSGLAPGLAAIARAFDQYR